MAQQRSIPEEQMERLLIEAAGDAALMDDFIKICSFGGRRSGSGQDSEALDWALGRLQEIATNAKRVDVPYAGWRCVKSSLLLINHAIQLQCNPLLRSASTPPEGIKLEVVDLGKGRIEDFKSAGESIRGRAVLVEHEYPFSPNHMHRRKKYDLAVAGGAAAFLIASPWAGGGLLSGSSGRGYEQSGIPAAYLDFESGQTLRKAVTSSKAVINLLILGEEQPNAKAGVGILDISGGQEGTVVISAHMDGHDLGQSALDNATGVAVALAATRALASHVSEQTPSLRVCFFCAEEWALAGSAKYLDQMSPLERNRIKLNINLDTVAGDDSLTALISDFPALKQYVDQASKMAHVPITTWLPLMSNSDHANFARHGIPAFRLVAGFDRPDSRVNNILSPGDIPAIIKESELRQALRATCALIKTALNMNENELNALALR
jgi:aminopeptidase YwaD